MELIKFRNDGFRRCQAIEPTHEEQCTRRRKHTKDPKQPTHQAGSLIWRDGSPHRHTKPGSLACLGNEPTTVWFDEAPVPPGTKLHEAMQKAARMASPKSAMFDGLDISRFVVPNSMRFEEESVGQQTFGEIDPSEELAEWWRDKAEDEIGKTVEKAIEYGSTDLIDIGMMLARTMNRQVDEAEAAELGVFFYLIGKIGRWQSSIQRGELPSDDTLFDIGVYVRMAQRIREVGGWPTKPE